MQMWIQIQDHDEDVQFSNDVTYEVITSGVRKVVSGTDIRLYSRGTGKRSRLIPVLRISVRNKTRSGRRPRVAMTVAAHGKRG